MFLGRTPAPDEPLWLDDDRSWALALLDVEDGECSGCGHPVSESMAKESEGKYTAHALRCWACAAAAAKSRQFESDGGNLAGLQMTVTRDP